MGRVAEMDRRRRAHAGGGGVAGGAIRAAPEADGDSFPELDCLRGKLPDAVLSAAEGRAARCGVGAELVLIAAGAVSEDDYLAALGRSLGVAFEPLDGVPRDRCPLADDRLIEAAAAGILPLTGADGALVLVIAPRGTAARRLVTLIGREPAQAVRFRFTSSERLNRFVMRYGGAALTARASGRLHETWPMLSAAPQRRMRTHLPYATAAVAWIAAAVLAPTVTLFATELTLATVFLAWLGLRLMTAVHEEPVPPPAPDIPDRALPVYSIIAALYREAASVDGLLSAIERFDYPAEKLNVVLAVEADDRETLAAIAARRHRLPVTVVPVPAAGPRTKPKALNVALPFARGVFTVVYDAEDRPEPDQLRRALAAFAAGDRMLACVQARLTIDNTADGWLAGLFTAEYAGQFDVFLPALAAWRLPLPLGGSSNHFDTAILREVCAWDAHNVTEDADLGMRLARFGYRCGTIASSTHEEAPIRVGAWMRQRTRWFKGWMRTWQVHMREPRRLLHDLGWPGFLAFQLIVGGNALAALVHPLFMAGLGAAVLGGAPFWDAEDAAVPMLALVYGANIAIGYLTSAVLGLIGLMRRGLLQHAWVLLLTPLHWLLLSLAAWRALYQLVIAPTAWEKTEHGLARHSRLATARAQALVGLERHLTALAERGELPIIATKATYTSASRRRRPQAAA